MIIRLKKLNAWAIISTVVDCMRFQAFMKIINNIIYTYFTVATLQSSLVDHINHRPMSPKCSYCLQTIQAYCDL